MRRMRISNHRKCSQILKWKQLLPTWALFLLPITLPVIFILSFHSSNIINESSSSSHLYNRRNEAKTFDMPFENRFTLKESKRKNYDKNITYSVIHESEEDTAESENSSNDGIGQGDAGEETISENVDSTVANAIEKGNRSTEVKSIKSDFVVNNHKFQSIKTEGRSSSIGYNKPFDLEKFSLPSLEEVQGLYGDKIVIHGLDQCEAYRNKVPGRLRYIAPAGLQNTGTNTLYKLLQRNCYIPERWAESKGSNSNPFSAQMDKLFDCMTKQCRTKLGKFDVDTGMRMMVAWWKHGPPSWRDNSPYLIKGIGQSMEGQSYDRMNALPIVMIKDPLHWMSSMCRNPYEVRFYSPRGKCPRLVLPPSTDKKFISKPRPVIIVPPKGLENKYFIKYDNLVDMWGTYYNEWITTASFPNLIVRYEDLLFHPKQVINQVCTCAGGVMRDDFQLMEKSSKDHGYGILGPKTSRTGLTAATIMYGTKQIRDSVLDHFGKKFARENLNSNVMNTFHYKLP